MPIKGMKSKDYLNFIGQESCPVTGKYPADLHHESLVRRFSGGLKKYFDYGALPLEHEVHLGERHQMGKDLFWKQYGLDPAKLAEDYLTRYIDTGPEDEYEALEALRMVRKDNDL